MLAVLYTSLLRFSLLLLYLALNHQPVPPLTEPVVVSSPRYDSTGLLDGYQTRIQSPVCETGQCYDIEIIFYHDLIGRYQSFDTLPSAGLTKLDHVPFTSADYQQLAQLLADTDAPLANYDKANLVRESRSSTIDGWTSATAREIQASVVNGAVYSCYTLWHLAHDKAISRKLQMRTYQELDSNLVQKIVAQQDQSMNYFLINHCSEQDFLSFLPWLLSTFERAQGYYPKQALERMPAAALQHPVAQAFFARHFEQLDYFAQIALLKKLQGYTIDAALAQSLQAQSGTRNSLREQLIQALIGVQQRQ